MIKKSFIFLEKISNKKEQNIWREGVIYWSDFLKKETIKGIAKEKKNYYNRRIKEAQQALLKNDSSFFINKLPAKEMWRLYGYFREETCFLDLEVDSYGKIILVGISDYYNSNFFLKNVNLDKSLIEKEINKYKLIVTFNGSSFDLPKLKKQMNIQIDLPHVDLKPLCVNLGLKGGLKEIERKLNLKRPQHLKGSPVGLWKSFHASGDKEYLDLLIEYNKEDIENLKGVIDKVYELLKI
jgi:uncharacterized protein